MEICWHDSGQSFEESIVKVVMFIIFGGWQFVRASISIRVSVSVGSGIMCCG